MFHDGRHSANRTSLAALPLRASPTPQSGAQNHLFSLSDSHSCELLRKRLEVHLFQAFRLSVGDSGSEHDFSKLDEVQFVKLARGLNVAFQRRDRTVGSDQSLPGEVDRLAIYLASRPEEEFTDIARGFHAEFSRRCTFSRLTAAPTPVTVARPPLLTRSWNTFTRDSTQEIRDSPTANIDDLRTVTPPTPRSYIPSPLRYCSTSRRIRTQHTHPIPLRRGSPLSTSYPYRTDSEPEGSAESEDYYADSPGPTSRSTVTRLQRARNEQKKLLEEKEATIRSLNNELSAAHEANRNLTRRISSLEEHNNALIDECEGLTDSLLALRDGRDTLEQNSCTYVSSNAEWADIDIDPHMKALLRDACHSDFHKDLVLATASDEVFAERVMAAIQTILAQKSLAAHPNGLEHRNTIRRLLVKLSRKSGLVPEGLLIQSIACDNKDPYSGGRYADIYQARHQDRKVALKRLRNFTSNREDQIQVIQDLLREAIVWHQLDHPNVLPFVGIDRRTFPQHLCMVSPWMEHGSVRDAMIVLKHTGHEIPYKTWLLQLARGLSYLHDENVVHGDVRGANVMIDGDLRVHVGDFGLAFFADTSTMSLGSHPGGSARWMAPELLKSLISRPNYACDVYSFGCTCVEIYSGNNPFSNIALNEQVILKVQQGIRLTKPLNTTMSDALWDLVSLCLAEDPSSRPSMSQVVSSLEVMDI